MLSKEEFKKNGGSWLGAVRKWAQWNCNNGDRVTWSSNDELKPPMTIKNLEDAAGEAAYQEYVKIQTELKAFNINGNEIPFATDDTDFTVYVPVGFTLKKLT